jgi:hypothetical protein
MTSRLLAKKRTCTDERERSMDVTMFDAPNVAV